MGGSWLERGGVWGHCIWRRDLEDDFHEQFPRRSLLLLLWKSLELGRIPCSLVGSCLLLQIPPLLLGGGVLTISIPNDSYSYP